MKKTKTIEYTVCDFEHDVETNAVGEVLPSGEHACKMHLKAFSREVRLPKESGGFMSGHRVPVTPGYIANMVIEYKKEK